MASSTRHMLALKHMRFLTLNKPISPGRPSHIAAASGLVRVGDQFYVVADDESHLGVFPVKGGASGEVLRLFEGELPVEARERKKVKPDLEALVLLNAGKKRPSLLLVPSGSKKNRVQGALLECDSSKTYQIDFSRLYHSLEHKHGVEDLNIEGAVVNGDYLQLFQRGNSKNSINAVIDLDLHMLLADLKKDLSLNHKAIVGIREYDLGKLGGIRLSFTDAAYLSPGRVVFLAAAEATDNSYDDAPCSGSVVGVINSEARDDKGNGKIESIFEFDRKIKAEGLHVEYGTNVGEAELYLVTDADDPALPAQLFKAMMPVH